MEVNELLDTSSLSAVEARVVYLISPSLYFLRLAYILVITTTVTQVVPSYHFWSCPGQSRIKVPPSDVTLPPLPFLRSNQPIGQNQGRSVHC